MHYVSKVPLVVNPSHPCYNLGCHQFIMIDYYNERANVYEIEVILNNTSSIVIKF